jgi:hypothetical protein
MKYKVARDCYRDFSGKASDAARQLAFGGIAAVWVFRPEDTSGVGLPTELLVTMAGLAFALLCDLLHYAYAAAAWGVYQYWYEDVAKASNSSNEEDGEVPDSPGWINYVTLILFWLKLISLVGAYVAFLYWLVPQAV